jgi:membrane protein required for beta-lactamase induction
VRINQTLFAPLFWYGIFGLGGAVLYLFTVLLPRAASVNGDMQPAWKKIGTEFLYALDGVPARAVAMTIAALCFNGKAFAVAMRRFRATDREAEIVLKLAVKMGLDFRDLPADEDELASEGIRRIHSAQDLRSNVLIFWIVVIALITIIS